MITTIICTYNRPSKIVELISLLIAQSEVPDEIIVVDSSDMDNELLKNYGSVKYLRSSHKNQPYQRYLGYLMAKHDWLLFLDDDMEPVHVDSIKSVKALPSEITGAVAYALRFENIHEESSLSKLPKSKINKGKNNVTRLIRWITGYPILNAGKVGWNGIRGVQPKGDYTEWFSGGAFFVKKDVIFQNFNFGLMTMFEKQIGMGEDFIIAYSIAQRGKIWATDGCYFYHNDQKDSSYSTDVKRFNQRVIYSRLYLTLEKARLTNRTKIIAILRYVYYAIWRGFGLIINLIINPSRKRFDALIGFISGIVRSVELVGNSYKKNRSFWISEARKDTN